jgi:hypothetical protein
MRIMGLLQSLILLLVVSLFCTDSKAEPQLWKMLDDGLYLGEFASTLESRISN